MARHFAIRTVRRYYLRVALEAEETGYGELALTFRAKQQAQTPATALPATIPAAVQVKLAAGQYRMVEDLDGADVEEVFQNTDCTKAEAVAVVAAIEALFPPEPADVVL